MTIETGELLASHEDHPRCQFPRLGTASLDEECVRQSLDISTGKFLKEACAQYETSLDFVLGATWAVILHQYTQDDCVAFSLEHCATTDSPERVCSWRTSINRERPIGELIKPSAWKQSPYAPGVDLFNTSLVIEEKQQERTESGPHIIRKPFQISLLVERWPSSPAVSLVFRPGYLHPTFAKALASSVQQCVRAILRSGDTHVGQINLFCPMQQETVTQWQGMPSVTDQFRSLSEVVHLNAQHRPSDVALDAWDGRWSYQELDDATSRLAAQLITHGVGPGVFVPVCFDKTCWAVVAMLAINKTGAAFVPIDPSSPAERRQRIILNVAAPVVLTSEQHATLFPPSFKVKSICVSASTLRASPSWTYLPQVPVEGPAYVLFTSGSTGEPKGCEISHTAFASLVNQTEGLRLASSSRTLQFASYSFGMSVIEVFCTLVAGGTVCIPSAEQRLSDLSTTMESMRVNWAILTPTVLASLKPEDLSHLRFVLVAGEISDKSQVDQWAAAGVDIRVAYGLTEWTGIFSVSSGRRTGQPTIGKPVNAHAWLVSPQDPTQLVPLGAPGELVIKGPGLAEGYLHDPPRTEASFLPHLPWLAQWKSLPGHVYRTGDIMRYHEDGSLVYLHRKDNQIKIRGLRVELGEIESHLTQALKSAKRVAVVACKPKGSSDLHVLVALILRPRCAEGHLVGTGQPFEELPFVHLTAKSLEELRDARERLRKQLPDYMVPQFLLSLTDMPTTVSGKIDRRRIRTLLDRLTVKELMYVAGLQVEHRVPATSNERVVYQMTCEVLGLTSVSMQDSFFDLAGDSVGAMKMAGLARQRGFRLTVKDIFEAPILQDLATRLTHIEEVMATTKPFALLRNVVPSQIVAEIADQTKANPAEIEDAYPCSALQEGLCALSMKDTQSYKARLICRLQPGIDLEAFRAAWERTYQINDILRTRFVTSSTHGTIQAVIQRPFEWDEAENLAQYLDVIEQRPMGLGSQLVRACLTSDSRSQHQQSVFVLALHHSICDRWSIRQLLEQIDRQVQAFPKQLELNPVKFRPFIAYATEVASKSSEYWTNQFRDIGAAIFPELPTPEYTPGADQLAQFDIYLPTGRVRDITIASYIRLAWALVIAHNTSTDDVVFGATVNGRASPVKGIETLTGPTIATVPVRINLDREQTVLHGLTSIQRQSIDMLPWEQAGLQNIRRFSPEADRACSFQNILTVQSSWGDHPTVFSDCEEGATVSGGFASYVLNIECYVSKDERQIQAKVAFDPRVLALGRVRRLLEHLQVVLNEITTQPERRLSTISALGPSDMSRLWEWNKAVPPKPKDLVHEIVQSHAYKTPKSPAVSAFDGELTFEDLEWHATQLAGELLQQCPSPGMLLPILFEKSVWVTVAMLAVLKIGSAIVALDEAYSIERIRTICNEVEAPLVICSRQMTSTVERIGLRPVVVAHDRAFFAKSASKVSLPPVNVHSDSPCYMIFTSGSTGMPKGLLVNHGAFAASMLGWMPALHVDNSSRVFQFSSFAFDACFAETFTALFAGACICVPSDTQRMNDLLGAMTELRITHAIFTPSTARVLRAEQIPSLRVLALVGEAMLPSDAAYWASRVRLLNGYGPAECAPCSTVQHIDGCSNLDMRDIGHPVGGVAWVCDPRDPEVLKPVGAAGELLLEGPNLGLGYFKDAAKTDAAFVQPRWLQTLRGMAGVRAYRSGDLVCYTEDGRLRYLGRIGSQVKLRGQRLDTSHIEHQLVQCFPGAAEVAVVVACPRNAGDRPTLAAFVAVGSKGDADTSTHFLAVPTKDFANRVATARVQLLQNLPGYMVPTLMIPVASLPKSAAGKLHRRALENEITSRTWKELSQYESVEESPTDRAPLDTERSLQDIWAKVLGLSVDAVGLRQSFFALGGDSITAMLVVAQARGDRVGLDVTVEDIFRFRTIEQIAAQVATRAATVQQLFSDEVVDVPFKLTPIQQLFFRTQGQQARHRFNHNLLLQLTQRTSYHRLESAMKTIVTTHPMLRARFVPGTAGLDWKQQIAGNVEGSFRCEHHVHGSMAHILADAQRSLSITAGPVFSADLIETGARQSILLVAHHLVVDLVSWIVILNDLDDLLRGEPISGQKSTSFQTWSRLLDEHARSQFRAARLPDVQPWDGLEDFWGVSQEQMTYGSCEEMTVRIEPETTDLLLGDVNKTFGTQPVEVLHAALLFAFIQAFPTRPPPITYAEAHGREPYDATIDLTRTVGWFTTLAPILLQLDSASDIPAVVGQVKDARRRLTRKGLDAFSSRQQAGLMEIVFNYGGRYSQQIQKPGALFEVQSFQTLNIFDAAADVRRWSVVDINSFVQDGQLTFTLTHPRGSSQTRIISAWILQLLRTLRTLASDFASAARIYTPMDFPLLKSDNAQLQRLLSSLSWIAPDSEIEDIYPCAPIQRGILLSQEKDRSLYHVTMVWGLQTAESGTPSVPRAKDAVHQVIACHPCLRTSFVRSFSERSLYDQVVVRNASPQIEVVHSPGKGLQGLPSAQGSPLTPECPSRFTIYVDQNQKIYIRLDATHALVDATSFSLIQRDLCLAYEGRLDISPGPPYANFIAHLQSQNGEGDRLFWEEELKGIHPCLFPSLTDYQPGDVDECSSLTVQLQHSEEIFAYCRAQSVTPANIFCLAWSLVLRSYVGSDDICFGVLASGRELPFAGAQDVVGPLINVLTFRNRLNHDLSVGECLEQVHNNYLRYLHHQTYPLADISHQKGDAALFNTVLSIQRIMASAPTSTSLNLVHRRDPVEYAIAVNIDMEPSRIAVYLRYWRSSLSSEQASLIASSFEQAVHQIITNDHLHPAQLDLVSPEHKRLLHRWNHELPAFYDAPIHETIQQIVRKTPDAPAVRWTKGLFTYRELGLLSDQLALHLRRQGLVPGALVPLCFDKSPWTVVAVLAVIKSGAAFALCDVTHPDSRLRSICQDLQSTIILCSPCQESRCKMIAEKAIVVGEHNNSWKKDDVRTLTPHLPVSGTRTPLFVVYTSGSTGKPKGVVIEHRSFCALVHYQVSVWRMSPAARVMQFASYAFDASVFEILFPLMCGACTCVLDEVERRDYLDVTMKRLQVTHAFLTPSVARQLSPAAVPDLQVLVCGGEPLRHQDLHQWAANVRLVDGYGPAECTVFSVSHPSLTRTSRPSDIGRPVGCVVWLVDPSDTERLMPVGSLGEILIEGPIVGRGYINNPQATESSFIKPPAWLLAVRPDLDPTTRLYKTGDLARHFPDGRLDIHGRKDSQIKIRGQRIELGEVEFQVQSCFPLAAGGVVVDVAPTGLDDGNLALFAFICFGGPISSSEVDSQVLRAADGDFVAEAASASAALFERLPAYMVPSYFLPLANLPINPSGKADRRYLKSLLDIPAEQLHQYRPLGKRQQRAPSSAEERLLHHIWSTTLGLDEKLIGADDNFFQVGGDSVSAMKVAAVARQQGLDISVADIFAHPRLSALAATSSNKDASDPGFEPTPFTLCPPDATVLLPTLLRARNMLHPKTTITDILPVSDGQGFFLTRVTLHHFSFAIEGKLDVERLRHACETVYQFFAILRTMFIHWRDQILQLVLDNIDVPFHHIVTDSDPAEAHRELRDLDRRVASVLDEQPPCAFILISDRSGTQHELTFRLSHAQWDGLSLAELFSAFGNAYHDRAIPPTTQLTTVVYHRLMRDKTQSLSFWRDYLQGSTMTSLIPTAPETTDLSPGTTIWENTNLQPAPEPPSGITMASVVKAAWALVIAQEQGRGCRDIVFGQTVNGRSSALPNIERIYGCCLNFIPVRIRLRDEMTIYDLLHHTQTQYQKTVAHDDVGFQNIVDASTDWPRGTYLNSIVQHQNIPLHHLMPLEGLKTHFSLNGYFRPGREVFIFTEPDGDILSVQFCANPNVIEFSYAQKLHRMLVDNIMRLCRCQNDLVSTLLAAE